MDSFENLTKVWNQNYKSMMHSVLLERKRPHSHFLHMTAAAHIKTEKAVTSEAKAEILNSRKQNPK